MREPRLRRRRHRPLGPHVRASELAEMGVCERKVLLAARYGKRISATQVADARRGVHAHAQFWRNARPLDAASISRERESPLRVLTSGLGLLLMPLLWLVRKLIDGVRRS